MGIWARGRPRPSPSMSTAAVSTTPTPTASITTATPTTPTPPPTTTSSSVRLRLSPSTATTATTTPGPTVLQDLRLLQLQTLLLWPLRLQGILLSGELTLDGLPRILTSTKTKNNTAKNLFQKKPCIKQN